jgi:hypothetical protein
LGESEYNAGLTEECVVSEHGVVWAMDSDKARGAGGLQGAGTLNGEAFPDRSMVGGGNLAMLMGVKQ